MKYWQADISDVLPLFDAKPLSTLPLCRSEETEYNTFLFGITYNWHAQIKISTDTCLLHEHIDFLSPEWVISLTTNHAMILLSNRCFSFFSFYLVLCMLAHSLIVYVCAITRNLLAAYLCEPSADIISHNIYGSKTPYKDLWFCVWKCIMCVCSLQVNYDK